MNALTKLIPTEPAARRALDLGLQAKQAHWNVKERTSSGALHITSVASPRRNSPRLRRGSLLLVSERNEQRATLLLRRDGIARVHPLLGRLRRLARTQLSDRIACRADRGGFNRLIISA